MPIYPVTLFRSDSGLGLEEWSLPDGAKQYILPLRGEMAVMTSDTLEGAFAEAAGFLKRITIPPPKPGLFQPGIGQA